MVKLKLLDGIEATIDDYHWKSNDKTIEKILNSLLMPFGPSGSDPDPDYNAALEAINMVGGEIIQHEPTESIEGIIY